MSVFGDPEVVPLWFGEGDLVTPDFVRDAAAKGLQAGETFYTWQRGIPELRATLSAYTERLYGIKCPVDRLTVTTGGATVPCTTNPQAAVLGVATFAGCKINAPVTSTLTATAGFTAPSTP